MTQVMQVIEANWPLVVLAAIALVLLAWWIFAATRKTSVELEDKPEAGTPAKRNQALIDAPPVAAGPLSNVANTDAVAAAPAIADAEAGPVITPTTATPAEAAPHVQEAAPKIHLGDRDDLTGIKGLGPKLAAQLHDLGIFSFAEIAAWDEAEIDRIDAQLGRFQGRIRRDNWVAQAKFLATGDKAGFEGQFGKV